MDGKVHSEQGRRGGVYGGWPKYGGAEGRGGTVGDLQHVWAEVEMRCTYTTYIQYVVRVRTRTYAHEGTLWTWMCTHTHMCVSLQECAKVSVCNAVKEF